MLALMLRAALAAFRQGFAFFIVVVGSIILDELSARIVGFRSKNEREACDMIMDSAVSTFDVLFGFVTTYHTWELVMGGRGFRADFCVPLSEVSGSTMKFEVCGVQRSFMENAYDYAFPLTRPHNSFFSPPPPSPWSSRLVAWRGPAVGPTPSTTSVGSAPSSSCAIARHELSPGAIPSSRLSFASSRLAWRSSRLANQVLRASKHNLNIYVEPT